FGLAKGVLSPVELNRSPRAQDKIVGLNLLRTLVRGRTGLDVLNDAVASGDLADDLVDDLVLDQKHIGHLAVVAIGPDVGAGVGVDELRVDAEAVVRTLNTAFKYITHAEFAAELADVH